MNHNTAIVTTAEKLWGEVEVAFSNLVSYGLGEALIENIPLEIKNLINEMAVVPIPTFLLKIKRFKS